MGKWEKLLKKLLLQRGHTIVLKVNDENLEDFTRENIAKADVAIEFSGPHSAYDNIKAIIEFGVPVVSGSTGWTERINEINNYCTDKKWLLFYMPAISV